MLKAGKFRIGAPAQVLMVDDDPSDVLLTQECFESTGFPVKLHHAANGEECLAFLRREGRYAAAPTPDLILLDINMPKMNGHQVMEELLADERLRHLPVVVLSTSSGSSDIQSMLRRRCNSYIVKPIDLDSFQEVIRRLCEYWFTFPELRRSV